MIGVLNHLLSLIFSFHYHSQKVIGCLGNDNDAPKVKMNVFNNITFSKQPVLIYRYLFWIIGFNLSTSCHKKPTIKLLHHNFFWSKQSISATPINGVSWFPFLGGIGSIESPKDGKDYKWYTLQETNMSPTWKIFGKSSTQICRKSGGEKGNSLEGFSVSGRFSHQLLLHQGVIEYKAHIILRRYAKTWHLGWNHRVKFSLNGGSVKGEGSMVDWYIYVPREWLILHGFHVGKM